MPTYLYIWFKFPRSRGLKRSLTRSPEHLSDRFDSNFPDLGDWNFFILEEGYLLFPQVIWFKFPRSRGLKRQLFKECLTIFPIPIWFKFPRSRGLKHNKIFSLSYRYLFRNEFDSNFPDLGDWNYFLKCLNRKTINLFDSNFPDLGDWNDDFFTINFLGDSLNLIQISPI